MVLLHKKALPPDAQDPEAATSPCFWWRRGRVDIESSILAMGLYPVFVEVGLPRYNSHHGQAIQFVSHNTLRISEEANIALNRSARRVSCWY